MTMKVMMMIIGGSCGGGNVLVPGIIKSSELKEDAMCPLLYIYVL